MPPTMFRSACGPLPVSMTATAMLLQEFDTACELSSASIRSTPVGSVCATACDGPVVGDESHSGIALHVIEPRLRNPRGVSSQRAVIELRDARAVRPAMLRRQAVDISLIIVEDDDDVARGLWRRPRLAHQREPCGGKNGGNRNRDRDSSHGILQRGTSHTGARALNKVGEPTRSALDRVPNEQPPFHGMAACCGARCQTTTRGYRGSWSGITQSVDGPLQRYVDRRLTILWTRTTLLRLHAEIDDEPELFAG